MKLITKCYERAKTKTRELFNPFLGPIRQKMALASKGQINSSFTIISNNYLYIIYTTTANKNYSSLTIQNLDIAII